LIQQNKDPVGPKPLKITGYPNKVQEAQNFLTANYVNHFGPNRPGKDMDAAKNFSNNDANKPLRFQLGVQRETVGRIIGRNGSTIKWISQSTGAKVEFNLNEDQNAPERTVIIEGTPNQVNYAAKLVRDLCNEPTKAFIIVNAERTGLVIGKNGATIRQVVFKLF